MLTVALVPQENPVAHRIEADVFTVGGRTRLWIDCDELPLAQGIEPFLIAVWVSAMAKGVDVRTETPVCPILAANLERVQTMMLGQAEGLHRIRLHAPIGERTPRRASGVGAFFTAGVDSFVTALQHDKELTHLVFVNGYDISLQRPDVLERVYPNLKRAADDLGKPLAKVTTNIREYTDRHADWGRYSFGSALAAVAHALSPEVGAMWLASSHADHEVCASGSHWQLDPLWTSSLLEFRPDAPDQRWRKVKALVEGSPVALKHLRVCYENRRGAYNCGRCEKCLRTMVSLAALDALESCPTFEEPLNLFRVARAHHKNKFQKALAAENLNLLADGRHPEIERALRASLDQRYDRGVVRAARRAWWKLKPRLRIPA